MPVKTDLLVKRIAIFISICILCVPAFAQNLANRKELSHYVFPEFVQGAVLKKSGERYTTRLNYNSLTQEMIFEEGGKKLALAQPEAIDTVFAGDKKFVPAGTGFYEVATVTPVQIYIRHKCQVTPPGTEAGFGGTSQTSASHAVNTLMRSGRAFALKLPDGYQVTPQTEYWLKSGKQMQRISNLKQLQKAFPGKSDAIAAYARQHKISFLHPDDVIKLVEYCNTL